MFRRFLRLLHVKREIVENTTDSDPYREPFGDVVRSGGCPVGCGPLYLGWCPVCNFDEVQNFLDAQSTSPTGEIDTPASPASDALVELAAFQRVRGSLKSSLHAAKE